MIEEEAMLEFRFLGSHTGLSGGGESSLVMVCLSVGVAFGGGRGRVAWRHLSWFKHQLLEDWG